VADAGGLKRVIPQASVDPPKPCKAFIFQLSQDRKTVLPAAPHSLISCAFALGFSWDVPRFRFQELAIFWSLRRS
jgi:hypothetical protein